MICPICQKQIRDDSVFCEHCGKKVPRCPTCGKVIRGWMRFCDEDGTPIPEEIVNLFTVNTQVPTQPAFEEAMDPTVRVRPAMETPVEPVEPTVRYVPVKRPAPAEVPPALVAFAEPAQPQVFAEPQVFTPAPAPAEFVPPVPEPAQPPVFAAPVEEEFALDPTVFEPTLEPQQYPADMPVAAPQYQFCQNCGRPVATGEPLCPQCQEQLAAANKPQEKKSMGRGFVIFLIVFFLAALIVLGIFVYKEYFAETDEDEDDEKPSASDRKDDEDEDSDEEDDRKTEDEGEGEGSGSAGSTEPTKPSEPEEEKITYEYRYEIIQGDLSWSEAKAACEAKGGYLATITSQEEYEKICKLADEFTPDLTYLWIGATLPSSSVEWKDAGWITGESWTFEKWYPGEPSKVDSDGTYEYYLCMWTVGDTGWTFNDQRNDIVEAFPSTSGIVGYVCEYKIEVRE